MEDEVIGLSSAGISMGSTRDIASTSGIHLVNAANVMTDRFSDMDASINELEQENNDLKGMVNDLERRNWELESKLDEKTRFYETQLYGFIRLVVAVLKEIDKDKFNRTLYTMKELLDCFDYSNSNEYYLTPNGEEVDEDIIE